MAFSLKEIIEAYARKIGRKFKLDEVCRFVEVKATEKIPRLETRVENLLEHNPYVFHITEKDQYIPRALYFKGSQFLIQPTADEVKSRVLIPGHRFIPFCNLFNFPAEFTLKGEAGRELSRKKIKRKVEELFTYLSLLDLFTLPDYLVFDDERNGELFKHEDVYKKYAHITVFDLKDFMSGTDFQAGDALLVEVEDWERCAYILRRQPAGVLHKQAAQRRKWIQKMDHSFDFIFATEGVYPKMEEQIAQAYFHAGKFMLHNPCIHFGGYLAQSRVVAINQVGEKHVLGYQAEEPGPEDFLLSAETSGNCESLEEILKDVHSPVSETEVEAFMRDELFGRKADLVNVSRRCFGGATLEFFDEYQQEKFLQYLEELWSDVQQHYNYFTDQVRGQIRRHVLKLYEEFTTRFKGIEDRLYGINRNLNSEHIFEVTRILKGLFSVLRLCNEETPAVEEEREKIEEIVDSLEDQMHRLMDELSETLKPELFLVKDDVPAAAPSGGTIVMKISLLHAKPPIWRRVLLPGRLTMFQLHQVIQLLFDWEDQQAHRFYARQGSVDGHQPLVDEEDTRLGELVTEPAEQLLYVHDFVNDWMHLLEVEKVLPAAALPEGQASHIVCLAGRRAAPPRSSGGMRQYLRLLAAFNDKKHPQHLESRRLLGAQFDPAAFDKARLNKKLADFWKE